MVMQTSLRLVTVVALSLVSQSASAGDRLSGQRSNDMRERTHRIDVVLDRGHATLVVRRTVENGGARHDEARFELAIPGGAVATGLRTLGTANGQAQWFNADLMEAEAAAERYRELTGIGGAYPKDPALLSWARWGGLVLQVFPVAPHGLKTVEYTLQMPMDYVGGRDVLTLPRIGTEELPADVIVTAADPRDRILRDGLRIESGAHLQADSGGEIALALERHDAPRLSGAFAVVEFAKDKTLVHTRIEAAAKLSVVPRGASVVVILDASRSLTARQAVAELAAARGYLAHFPDARAEVLTFDRSVHARNGGLVPVFNALLDLSRAELTLGNGSQIDDALEQADALLASAPGARRIVVMTDRRTRASLAPGRLKTLLGRSGAVVHVSDIDEGAPSLQRDDQDEWAPMVRATGGICWHATASTSDPVALRRTYEEWARPLRIDRLFVQVDGAVIPNLIMPETLAEGEGFDDVRAEDTQPTGLSLAGELWATPIQAALQPNSAQNRLWAALVFGTPQIDGMNDKEMMVLARMGRAVSPVTSYLAVEPGVRPSTEGLETSGSGAAGRGIGIGVGREGTVGLLERAASFDHQAFLQSRMAQAWMRCGGGARKLELRIDTTLAEVVDVPSSVIVGGGGATAIERCMAEAAWSLDLPDPFRAREYETWTVRL